MSTHGVNGYMRAEPCPSIPIAIVGMACRFGGDATSPSKLWDLCAAGKDGWAPVPETRFDVKSLYHPNNTKVGRVSIDTLLLVERFPLAVLIYEKSQSHVVGGYFLSEDVALFDAAFFNLASDVASVSLISAKSHSNRRPRTDTCKGLGPPS